MNVLQRLLDSLREVVLFHLCVRPSLLLFINSHFCSLFPRLSSAPLIPGIQRQISALPLILPSLFRPDFPPTFFCVNCSFESRLLSAAAPLTPRSLKSVLLLYNYLLLFFNSLISHRHSQLLADRFGQNSSLCVSS